jgi:hypothetical protein
MTTFKRPHLGQADRCVAHGNVHITHQQKRCGDLRSAITRRNCEGSPLSLQSPLSRLRNHRC